MAVTTTVKDMSGRDLEKGDTVSTLTGQMTGKICNLAEEEDAAFICIRPPHQPYGNGIWHAADRCVLVTPARPTEEAKSQNKPANAKSASNGKNGHSTANTTSNQSNKNRTRKTPAKKK